MSRPSSFFIALTAALIGLSWPLWAQEISHRARPTLHEITGDLTLDRAVNVALRQNPDILKQLSEIERTRGLVIEARGQALPHLVLNANYDQQDANLVQNTSGQNQNSQAPTEIIVQTGPSPGPGQPAPTIDLGQLFSSSSSNTFQPPDKTWQVALEIQQLIYSGGQVRAAMNIAKFTEDSAYYQLREIIDQVVAAVRVQFYTVLTNRSLITVQEESVRLQQDLLTDQKNRFEAGTVPRFNVLRAEVELANVVPLLIRAKNEYLISELDLAKTLGLDPGPDGKPGFQCVGVLAVTPRNLNIVQSLELARARRAFLKVQRQQIKIQAENIKIALSGYKPQITGRAGYLTRNSRITDDIGDTVDGWFFGFTGTWNIFDGLETNGRVKQAKAQLEAARVTYLDSVHQVELEVQQAYSNLIANRETIRSQQKNVEQAQEALRLANERLGAGAGTQLELLDARVALTRAQTTELVARGDYNRSLAEFDRATGTNTAYEEKFKDPLMKLERKILGPPKATPAEPASPAKKKKK